MAEQLALFPYLNGNAEEGRVVFARYIRRNGKIIYPRKSKVFRFVVKQKR